MTAKLFTIGDSVCQGCMSGAAANTHLCYSTLLSQALNNPDYRYLKWQEKYKTKIDLERILRKLEAKCGSNIRGLEWLKVLPSINGVLDVAEDYFERGAGNVGQPIVQSEVHLGFHNVAVEGMDVADAFLVTPNLCKKAIDDLPRSARKDGYMSATSAPFYRRMSIVIYSVCLLLVLD